ncbi:MAG: hypothetical protein R3344_02830 [Acidobacteriota bacterium]|nr:hypothetical protein [Acidobacteriota bacterium]
MKILVPALFLAAAIAAPAFAVQDGSYSVEVLIDGRPVREYLARGTNYVEAIREAEYAVRLRNRTGRRVAVALSVDGLNSIDAKTTTARDASKWILGPYETITVSGWQTSSDSARRFFFTTEDRSYGAWLGKTDNLGVISAAFFREIEAEPVPYSSGQRRRMQERQSAAEAPGRPSEKKRAAADAGAAPEAEGLSDDHAATGIGREVDHRVRRVRFDAERDPASVIRIRYEYRDALVSLGVLPYWEHPLSRRENARGFEQGFAPDPYR